MSRLTIEVDASRMKARLSGLATKIHGPELVDAAGHYMASTALPMRFRKGGPGWAPVKRGGSPLRDTGALSKSFSHTVDVSAQVTIVSSNSIHAGPQHRGDTIRPKRTKYLAIPLPTLTISEGRTKGPRDFADTKVFKSKKGNLLVWRKTGMKPYVTKSGKAGKPVPVWEPIFVLKTSVTLTARPFMFISDEDAVAIARRLEGLIRVWLSKGA